MKIAIISDIHGNLEAFQSVLYDIAQQNVEHTLCLGDAINYGADSEKVLNLLQQENIPMVQGNHEIATIQNSTKDFNYTAAKSLRITRSQLSVENMAYIMRLPLTIETGRCLFVHGAPPDSAQDYIFYFSEKELLKIMNSIEQQLVFTGHTHLLMLMEVLPNNTVKSLDLIENSVVNLNPEHRYIVNVGSVGQPRDTQSKKAKYVTFDDTTFRLEIRAVAYDVDTAVQKIAERGFPDFNAARLLEED